MEIKAFLITLFIIFVSLSELSESLPKEVSARLEVSDLFKVGPGRNAFHSDVNKRLKRAPPFPSRGRGRGRGRGDREVPKLPITFVEPVSGNQPMTFPQSNSGSKSHIQFPQHTTHSSISAAFPIRFDNQFPSVTTPKHKTAPIGASASATECSIDQVYYEGQCQYILKKGSCQDGYWIILDSQQGIPYCAKKPCSDGYLLYNGQCVSATTANVCGPMEILYVDYTGDVYCDCMQFYIYDAGLSKCHAQYERGSCSPGYHLRIVNNEKVDCVLNPCVEDNLIQDPKTKQCLAKNYKGSCSEEKLLTQMGTFNCGAIDTRNFLSLYNPPSCPAGSKKDYFDKCQREFKFNSRNPFAFRSASQFPVFSECKQGYTKFPGETFCRSVNPTFG